MKIEDIQNDGDVRFVDDERCKGTLSYAAHKQRYLWVCEFLQGLIVLDAGCGSGYGTYYLATHGVRKILGVDKSQKAIEYAQSRYQAPNLRFKQIDLTSLFSLEEKFDAVISFDVIEHIWNYNLFLQNLHRNMKPDGTLIIGTPNKEQTLSYNVKWNAYHPQEFSSEELECVLSKYFREVIILGQHICEEKRNFFIADTSCKVKRETLKNLIAPLLPKFIKRNTFIRRITGVEPMEVKALNPGDVYINDTEVNRAFGLIAICKTSK